MNSKRFYTGDLVFGYCYTGRSDVYGIIINDDVFHDGVKQDQYVKVMWNYGKVTTSNTLGMIKVKVQ